MIVKTNFCRGVALFWLALAGPALADNARLPYHQLYYAQKLLTQFNRLHTNLIMALTVQSIQPTVQISDLAMYIDAKSGKVPVDIGAAGALDVPLRDDLVAEDPWVVVNQPRGTMKLSWQAGVVPGPIGASVHYARLLRPVQDLQDIQEELRKFVPAAPTMMITGVKLSFAPSEKKAAAVIRAKGGERKIEVNDRREIILPLVPELLAEDPEISLSAKPLAIGFVFQKTGN